MTPDELRELADALDAAYQAGLLQPYLVAAAALREAAARAEQPAPTPTPPPARKGR